MLPDDFEPKLGESITGYLKRTQLHIFVSAFAYYLVVVLLI